MVPPSAVVSSGTFRGGGEMYIEAAVSGVGHRGRLYKGICVWLECEGVRLECEFVLLECEGVLLVCEGVCLEGEGVWV